MSKDDKKAEVFNKFTSIIGALLLIGIGYVFVSGVVGAREAAIGGGLFLLGGLVMIAIGIALLFTMFKDTRNNKK